ncbi:diacylglycerol/lipid kinase family protein [Corynebacterium cystitidis]|uniref:Lipid kinase, YegS/Rv2252/BmrU family n=1 Tax=Corynebacterium cystitidis DSM 20524 TaxID=1121357 RepID=A0A1H9PWL3_9CORY|nr:diacylglycerol kinase family protein [Corynebacterium cystitidis]WJY82367.1 Lipid kinase YegS [Corynebacterium cystitidis DSM 20524]SER52159.1 lipid kinase, YegS/Rv2252/BmrU family [Corynebacterium cystitidis DSM 20524]SNV76174.1 putative diacylglycerol kinase [Corynebacterium cystitidis]
MTNQHGQKVATIIYNPVKAERSELEELAARYDEGYSEIHWKETTEEDPGYSQAQKAVSEGADVVIACGGDGTVRLVAAALANTDSSLGIVPAGTGNLLARNLKLKPGFEEAMQVALQGEDRPIDICYAEVDRPDSANEKIPFVVMAGVGIDAQMIENTDDDLKAKIGFLAYGVAIAKSLKGGDRIKLLRRIDRGRWQSARAHSVIVGNCGDLVNNITLLPNAIPDDGKLDIVIMRPKGIFGWINIFGQMAYQMVQKLVYTLRGRGEEKDGEDNNSKSLRYLQGKQIDIKFSHTEDFEVDGDPAGRADGFSVTVDPAALSVRVPRGSVGE